MEKQRTIRLTKPATQIQICKNCGGSGSGFDPHILQLKQSRLFEYIKMGAYAWLITCSQCGGLGYKKNGKN